MPRNPKCFFNNSVLEISSSIQEGLPFVATPYFAVIIEGILASASTQYPITICHYIFMGNHFHLICIVHNPEDVPKFMRYLKCELGHAINRLCGRSQRSVWVSGYDSVIALDPAKVMDRIAYLYLNPVTADLVDKISEYPGVSSYRALLEGNISKTCKKISRDQIFKLPDADMSIEEQELLARKLEAGKGINYKLKIQPWAFLKCFKQCVELQSELYKKELLNTIADREHGQRLRRTRRVIGPHALRIRSFSLPYTSKRSGFKTFCMSSDIELRKAFTGWFKGQIDLARKAFAMWKIGALHFRPPPGFFTPGGHLLASALLPLPIG